MTQSPTPTQSVSSDPTHTKVWISSAWLIWGIATLFYAYEFVHRVAPSVLTYQLKSALSITQQQLGSIGAMYFYAYALFQLPAGILIDRHGIKKILVIASLVLTFGSFLFTFSESLLTTQISRLLIGAGSAFAFIGCLKIAAEWFPKRHFPLIVGLTNLSGTLGALFGGRPLARWVMDLGWRDAFFFLSCIGLIITVLLLRWVREPSTKIATPQPSLPWFFGLKHIIASPYAWVVGLYGALLVAPIAAIPEMWGVEYLQMAYQVPSTIASNLTHTIFIGTALGGPLIGWFMLKKENPLPVMRFSTICALIFLTLFLYAFHKPSWIMAAILLAYGFFTANMLLCFTIMTNKYPTWAQGAAIGFTNMLIMLFAGGIQQIVGWLLDYVHPDQTTPLDLQHYQITLAVLPICLMLALALTMVLKRIKEPQS